MTKAHSIQVNFIMNSILTASAILFPLITFPYVSRILGPEGTGTVSFASSIISYFTIFAQQGIPVYGIRACARVREDKQKLSQTVTEIFTLSLITCVISYLCLFLAITYVPRMRELKTLFIISSASVLLNIIGVEWLYKGLELYTYIAVRSIIFKLIAIIAIFLFVRSPEHSLYYAAITVFALHGSYIVNFINLRKYVDFTGVKHLNIRQHLKPVLVFFAMSVSTTIYTHLDSAMLGFMQTDTDVGYYSTSTNIKALLVNFISSLGTVLLPRMSYYLEKGMKDEFFRFAEKSIHFVILAAAPLMVYFMLYARETIFFIAGSQFEGSIAPMIIIMPTVLFIGLTNIMGIQMLIPMGRETLVMLSTAVGASIDLVINLLLIPQYKASGAAFGTLVAEIAVFIFQACVLKKYLVQIYHSTKYLLILFSISVSSVISLWAASGVSGNFITLLISSIAFFGVYALILCLFREPLVMELKNQLMKKFCHRQS